MTGIDARIPTSTLSSSGLANRNILNTNTLLCASSSLRRRIPVHPCLENRLLALPAFRLNYARSRLASNAFCSLRRHQVFCLYREAEGKTPSPLHATMQLWIRPLDHPIRNLVILCVGWKLLLLLIAVLSPGPGYDTSASLYSPSAAEDRQLPPAIQYILCKLVRWDAIYFVQTAHRGYVFEQEWAFGWGFSRLISLCTAGERFLWLQRKY